MHFFALIGLLVLSYVLFADFGIQDLTYEENQILSRVVSNLKETSRLKVDVHKVPNLAISNWGSSEYLKQSGTQVAEMEIFYLVILGLLQCKGKIAHVKLIDNGPSLHVLPGVDIDECPQDKRILEKTEEIRVVQKQVSRLKFAKELSLDQQQYGWILSQPVVWYKMIRWNLFG